MRKPATPNSRKHTPVTPAFVLPDGLELPLASSPATAACRSLRRAPSRNAAGTAKVKAPSLQDVKVALVLEGVLPVEAAFPMRKDVPRLPSVDDLELSADLPTVKSGDEPVQYAGGRYALPPATNVSPGSWSAEVRFGANGRWIRRLEVEEATQAEAEDTARRVLETAVKNLVSLEKAYAAVRGE
jgi:hypothetical protein